jgi:tetratricopeptide (TPR) repeat protein
VRVEPAAYSKEPSVPQNRLLLISAAAVVLIGVGWSFLDPRLFSISRQNILASKPQGNEIQRASVPDVEVGTPEVQESAPPNSSIEELIETGQLEDAVILGVQLVGENFDNANVHFLLARAYFGLSQHDNALKHFRYASLLQPENELYAITLKHMDSAEAVDVEYSPSEATSSDEVEELSSVEDATGPTVTIDPAELN